MILTNTMAASITAGRAEGAGGYMKLLVDGLESMPAEYFQVFAVPDDILRPHCLKCKSELLYSFRWGIAHGEGVCGKCGWPTRLYHFVKQPDGSEKRLVQLLQYHPSEIKGQHRRKLPKWPSPKNGMESEELDFAGGSASDGIPQGGARE